MNCDIAYLVSGAIQVGITGTLGAVVWSSVTKYRDRQRQTPRSSRRSDQYIPQSSARSAYAAPTHEGVRRPVRQAPPVKPLQVESSRAGKYVDLYFRNNVIQSEAPEKLRRLASNLREGEIGVIVRRGKVAGIDFVALEAKHQGWVVEPVRGRWPKDDGWKLTRPLTSGGGGTTNGF